MTIIRTIKASGLFSVSLIVTVKKREQTISGSFPSSSKSLKSGILLSRSISLTDPQMLCHDEPHPLPSHERYHGLRPDSELLLFWQDQISLP